MQLFKLIKSCNCACHLIFKHCSCKCSEEDLISEDDIHRAAKCGINLGETYV